MLSNFVKLKRYNFDGKEYYNVSEFLNTFDTENPDNAYIVDGLTSLSRDCFIDKMNYVSTQSIADMLIF